MSEIESESEIGELRRRVVALERHVAAMPGIRFRAPPYVDGMTFIPGDLRVHLGSLWYCRAITTKRPPGDEWTLCAKHGRNHDNLEERVRSIEQSLARRPTTRRGGRRGGTLRLRARVDEQS